MMKTTLLITLLASTSTAYQPQCRQLKDIYSGGKEICENLFPGSFKYVPTDDPDYDLAYTMWFLTEENPNDIVTEDRIDEGLHMEYNNTDVCHLNYFHKDFPSEEPDTIKECHPWRHNSCCSHENNFTPETLNENYGSQYHWDKCGKLSQACERFFVQEACFYECDVNAGLFRKYAPNTEYDGYYNEWQLHGMPIKGDYCDNWYTACKYDYFCVDETQGFFSCPMDPVNNDAASVPDGVHFRSP